MLRFEETVQRIYLDHNATTPLLPAVIDRMTAVRREEFGTPPSVHHFGQQAKAAVDDARSEVAELIGADPSEVLFTSGGTEGDNIGIRAGAEDLEAACRAPPGALGAACRTARVPSPIKDEAGLTMLKASPRRGWQTTLLPVDKSGIVS